MCIHDEKGNVEEKIKQIEIAGFSLLDHFVLSIDIWMKEYCRPLEKAVEEIVDKERYSAEIKRARSDIDFFKNQPERCESVCFIVQKK